LIVPLALAGAAMLIVIGVPLGFVLIGVAASVLPIGIISMRSDRTTTRKDVEFATFLRSVGGMASSSGTTLKESLTKIDLSSFPVLEEDINRLSTRLQARVNPELCWHKFGLESGSRLISEVVDIFYGGISIGGDPERVGYLCSLFTARTVQLRAKRRLTSGTFSGLATVMQAVVSGLMVFVFSIVNTFALMVVKLAPPPDALSSGPQMSIGMANFSPSDLAFLSNMTTFMIIGLAGVSAVAVILSDGGYKPKVALYSAMMIFISGVMMLIVPGMVAGILKQ
jgi:flagellar protein FlaJ